MSQFLFPAFIVVMLVLSVMPALMSNWGRMIGMMLVFAAGLALLLYLSSSELAEIEQGEGPAVMGYALLFSVFGGLFFLSMLLRGLVELIKRYFKAASSSRGA